MCESIGQAFAHAITVATADYISDCLFKRRGVCLFFQGSIFEGVYYHSEIRVTNCVGKHG